MKAIQHFVSVLNVQTLIVTLLAVGATFACHYFGWEADIPTGLIGLAVVFPIVFSINTAYKRREEALKYFSGFKAHAVALYYAHRDWVPAVEGGEDHPGRVRALLDQVLSKVASYLHPDGRSKEGFEEVYKAFGEISGSNESMRAAGVPANEVSRVNQFLSKMMIDFENMRNIATYRTPISLRAYSTIFLHTFPIAFGPYFAHLVSKSDFPPVGYGVAVLYSLVLVTLDNIQDDLEDPFDGVGTDDVQLDVVEDYRPIISG